MSKKITIGRFHAIRRLGSGYHGQVFLCWDPELERKVAIKLITPKNNPPELSLSLVEEAMLVAKLTHPCVIPIYDAFIENNTPVLVFEYVDGVTLKEHIKQQGKYDEYQALSLLAKIAAGLQCAHDQGIAHLDLSPNNIMLDKQGRPRIMDFGLAQLTQSSIDESDMEETMVSGTARYMCPEHMNNEPLTPASDIFTLGLVFYEMLTGEHAINGNNVTEAFRAIKHVQIDWGKIQYLQLTPEIVAVLQDMLQKDSVNRYRSANELVIELDQVIYLLEHKDNPELTLDFLMRRLQRRNEFPACSQRISELNQLLADNSSADFEQIGKVILQDYALTNRIMKIANSVTFSNGGGNVTKISQAISRLGLKLLRTISNCLLMFNQVDDENHELKDVLIISFTAGFIAKNLTEQQYPRLAEEAFISALFHRLGYHLLAYYLYDEYQDLKKLLHAGKEPLQAERQILATTCNNLGKRMAQQWNFPDGLIQSMSVLPQITLVAPENHQDYLTHMANYSNELCQIIDLTLEPEQIGRKLQTFFARHRAFQNLTYQQLNDVLDVISEDLIDLMNALGVSDQHSDFIQRLAQCKNFASAQATDAIPTAQAISG